MRWKWSCRTARRSSATGARCGANRRKLEGFRLARTRFLTIMTRSAPGRVPHKAFPARWRVTSGCAPARRDGFTQAALPTNIPGSVLPARFPPSGCACAAKRPCVYVCVHTWPSAPWTRWCVSPVSSLCGRAHTRPQRRKRTMKTGFAVLVGAGVLALAVGSANADTRHHHRHMAKSHAVQQAPASVQANEGFVDNHNPAKKYPTRQISETAVKTGTLHQNGNNPAKRYTAQRPIEGAMREGTLPQSGNNPAKRYKSTTTGAASR